MSEMFCFQCQQTAGGTGCVRTGVCGKQPETANLQDQLLYELMRLALAEAFDCSVSDLPLTLVLSWYEQKAVCILLTLLSLGIRNMYLGPALPAFLSETVVNVLADTYGLQPITVPEQDIDAILHRG